MQKARKGLIQNSFSDTYLPQYRSHLPSDCSDQNRIIYQIQYFSYHYTLIKHNNYVVPYFITIRIKSWHILT